MKPLQHSSLDCSNRLTELLEFACSPEFEDEMVVARELFMLLAGKVNDEDVSYEQRMQCFQEFFLFEHRLTEPHAGQTLLEVFLQRAQERLEPAEVLDYEQFRSAGRSLFRIDKFQAESANVRDLLGNRNLRVHALCSFSLSGIPSGQVFEARLVNFAGLNFFTGAFIFHPPSVTDLIEKMVKVFLSGGAQVSMGSPGESLPEEETGGWRGFLKARFDTLRDLQNRRESYESAGRKRAVDHLTLSRRFVDIYRLVSTPDQVTALSNDASAPDSTFIPEGPVLSRTSLLSILAQCEIRCLRYRHIEPAKVYAQSLSREGDSLLIQRPERAEEHESQRPAARALA